MDLRKNLVLMQRTSAYPTPFKEANLKVLEYYKIKYNLSVGLSDHTPGIISPIVSVGFGVRLIEKHFTLSKKMKGPDHKASLDPKELKNLVTSLRIAEKLLGSNKKKITKEEKKIKLFQENQYLLLKILKSVKNLI